MCASGIRFPFRSIANRSFTPNYPFPCLPICSEPSHLIRLTSVHWPKKLCDSIDRSHLYAKPAIYCRAQVSLDEPEVVVLIELVKEYSA